MIGEEIGGAPCACPDWVCPRGARPFGSVRRTERWREGSDPANWDIGAWGRFRAHLSAASARRYHQISFPGVFRIGAADRNRTRVFAVAPHGSAIELRTRAQSRTRTCEAKGTRFTVRPRCRLSICARLIGAGDLAIARTCIGGRLTVRTPHLAVPTRFQDGLPATPAEPSGRLGPRDLAADVIPGLMPGTTPFKPRAARPSRGSPPSSHADSRVETRVWQPAAH